MTATLSAQNNKSEQERLPVKEEERSPQVCTIPEQLPFFPGGEAALLAYETVCKGSSCSVSSFSRTVASARYKLSNLSNRIATLKPSAW